MSDIPVFTITRVFEAPRAVVFDAWADPEKMVQWSGPPGAKLTTLSGSITEGSVMHTRSDHPQMGTTYTLALWREVRPHSRIVWEQSFADETGAKVLPSFFKAWPLTLLTEVDFEDAGVNTRVTLRWTPIEGSEEDFAEFARMMSSMNQGWGGSFDELEKFLRD